MGFRDHLDESLWIGVLNIENILDLVKEGVLIGANSADLQSRVDLKQSESAIDLRLSSEGWELKSTVKPKGNADRESVRFLISKHGVQLKNVDEGVVLKRGTVYLFKLQESLNLKEQFGLSAQASGKSSIGRLDVLTRLLIDGSPVYDEVSTRYHGDLFVEIIPLSFSIIVKTGSSVNQLRFFRGTPEECRITPKLLSEMATPVILDPNGETKKLDQNHLSVDLSLVNCGSDQACAFVARQGENLDAIDISKSGFYEPERYWERKKPTEDVLEMSTDRFYILRSKERFYLPNNVAVRCVAYTENLGETRIHYAGFAHPWFSRSSERSGKKGAPLIFEVRCHSFPVLVRDGEDFARIEFYRMIEPTYVENQNYDTQELKLSKCFHDWK